MTTLLPNNFPTQNEYRIPERDAVKGPPLVFKGGDWVTFTRLVSRVGYEIGSHSVTKEQWRDCGVSIVAEKAGMSPEDVEKVLSALGLKSPLKMLRREIYGKLVKPLAQSAKDPFARALWFVDLPSPVTGQVDKRVSRWTGRYDPGFGPSYSDSDCQPPSLCNCHHQHLYLVRLPQSGQRVMVYPSDVQTETSDDHLVRLF